MGSLILSAGSDILTFTGVGVLVKGDIKGITTAGKFICGTSKAIYTGSVANINHANAVRSDMIYSYRNWKNSIGDFANDITPIWGALRAWNYVNGNDCKVIIR